MFKGLRYLATVWTIDVKYIRSQILSSSLFTGHHGCLWQQKWSRAALLRDARLRSPRVKKSVKLQKFPLRTNRRSCRRTISSCVKPKTSIQQTLFDPTAIEPGSWKDSSNPSFFTRKIHTSKWITSSLCGTFYEVTKLEHLRMPNLNSKRLWNNYLPAKLTEKGSPFYQILGISIKEPAVPISINHFC